VVKLILPDEAVEITGGSTASRAPFPLFTALEEISGKNVITIGNHTFANCGKLKAVSLPAAETFGNSVFLNCPALTTLDIPSAVRFGIALFLDSGLTTLNLPASFTTIATNSFTYSFTGAKNLTLITVHPDNPAFSASGGMLLSKDGKKLVAYPGAHGDVTLPAGIQEIGDRTFSQAANLTNLVMPGVTHIEQYAFYQCANLKKISGPQVNEVGDYAFYACSGLEEISLPLAETFGDNVLRDCKGLTAVTLENVKSIGVTTFRYNGKLASISLPHIETIGCFSFAELADTITITFGETAPTLLPLNPDADPLIYRYFAVRETRTVILRLPQGATGYDENWKSRFTNDSFITLNVEEITG
jgi:hypothetical protein